MPLFGQSRYTVPKINIMTTECPTILGGAKTSQTRKHLKFMIFLILFKKSNLVSIIIKFVSHKYFLKMSSVEFN